MGNLTKQVHKIQGLNLRGSDLNKDDSFSTECENVELTQEGYLVKRRGYAELVVDQDNVDDIDYFDGDGIIQLIEVSAQFTLNNTRTLFGIKPDGVYGWDAILNVWRKFVYGGSDASPVFNEPTSFGEFNGILYLADPSGTNELFKVDTASHIGPTFYRSGLPKPTINSITPSGVTFSNFFVRILFEHDDGPSNFIQGDYYESDALTADSLTINLDTLQGTGFLSNSDVVPQSIRAKVFVSYTPTFGYTEAFNYVGTIGGFGINTQNPNENIVITNALLSAALAGDTPLMSDTYDATVRKGLPPKSKYLTFYNGLMVLGDLSSVKASDANLVNWSDLTTGGTVESFPSLNQQDFGKSDEAITGLFGDSDNLVVFKERNVFYLSGDLVNGNYRLRDSLSEGIGCIAHQSIIKVQGGAIFLSEKGIYIAKDGYKPIEFSDIIEPLFTRSTDLLFSKAVAVLDRLNEKILLFIPHTDPAESIVVQYDYYHNQWFILKGIQASGGFTMFKDELAHSDGTKVFVRHTARNDDGVAISASYSTAWMALGKPSVKKKFTKFLAFSIDQSDWKLSVRVERNWTVSADTPAVIQFPYEVGSEDISLPASQCHSMRIILSNAELDENIMLNGYNYEFAETQDRFKGGD